MFRLSVVDDRALMVVLICVSSGPVSVPSLMKTLELLAVAGVVGVALKAPRTLSLLVTPRESPAAVVAITSFPPLTLAVVPVLRVPAETALATAASRSLILAPAAAV